MSYFLTEKQTTVSQNTHSSCWNCSISSLRSSWNSSAVSNWRKQGTFPFPWDTSLRYSATTARFKRGKYTYIDIKDCSHTMMKTIWLITINFKICKQGIYVQANYLPQWDSHMTLCVQHAQIKSTYKTTTKHRGKIETLETTRDSNPGFLM